MAAISSNSSGRSSGSRRPPPDQAVQRHGVLCGLPAPKARGCSPGCVRLWKGIMAVRGDRRPSPGARPRAARAILRRPARRGSMRIRLFVWTAWFWVSPAGRAPALPTGLAARGVTGADGSGHQAASPLTSRSARLKKKRISLSRAAGSVSTISRMSLSRWNMRIAP